jgi:hypothetical protein
MADRRAPNQELEGDRKRLIRTVAPCLPVLAHARPARIIELRADYEIDPPLTAIAAEVVLLSEVFRPTGGSSGCSGCVSDQRVGSVRALIVVRLSKSGREEVHPSH